MQGIVTILFFVAIVLFIWWEAYWNVCGSLQKPRREIKSTTKYVARGNKRSF